MLTQQISYPADAHAQTRKIEDTSYWYQHRNDIIRQTIKKYVTGYPAVYDLGGGNGVVTKALLDDGYPCILVEALPEAITIAKERNISAAVQLTIQNFNEKDLPVILLLDVLEHIEKEEEILQKLFHQSDKNGTIIITVPAYNHLYTDIDDEIGHFRRYSASQLSKLAENAGFKVIYSGYFFSLLYFPLLFSRVIPYKLKLKKKDKNRRVKEHLAGHSILNSIIRTLLKFELIFIKNKIKIPLGTSCILVATKK